MDYKILTRRSTYLNRTIIYEVNGEVKQISAPRGIYSFEQLEERIRNSTETEPQSSKDSVASVDEPEPKKTTSKKSKKTIHQEKGSES